MPLNRLIAAAGLVVLAAALAAPAAAQSEFTYQGVLSENGSPVTGTESIRFRLYDAPVGGTLFGETTQNVDVADGVFTAPLNLGTLHTIDPASAWLEIAVDTGGGSFDTLGRQKITAAPFAMNTRGIDVDAAENVAIGGEVAIGQRTFTSPARMTIEGGANSTANDYIEFVDTDTKLGTWVVNGFGAPGNSAFTIVEPGVGSRLTLRSGGRLGLNTNSPGAAALHVRNEGADQTLILDRAGASNVIRYRTYPDSSFASPSSEWIAGARPNGQPNGQFIIAGEGQPAPTFVVDGATGHIGLNTAYGFQPQARFEIRDSATGPSLIFNNNQDDFESSFEAPNGTYTRHVDTDSGFTWDVYANENDYAIVRSGIASAFTISALDGNVVIGNGPPSTFKLDVGGNIRCVNLMQTSSSTYKDDIVPMTSALESIAGLRGVTYTWNDTAPEQVRGLQDIGFIAEEVNDVLPQIVAKDENGVPVGIDYGKMTPVLVEAIKEMEAEHDEALAHMQRDNDALRIRLERLEQMLAASMKNSD